MSSRITLHTLQSAPKRPGRFWRMPRRIPASSPTCWALANAPAALETYVTVSALNGKSELSLAEREVVQLIAATRHGCDFCAAGHTRRGAEQGQLPQE